MARRRRHWAPPLADATGLSFEDESFDYVVSCLMLHHTVEWPTALVEMHRVLKPRGRLLGYDLTATRLARIVHWADWSPHRLITPTELADADQSTLR